MKEQNALSVHLNTFFFIYFIVYSFPTIALR